MSALSLIALRVIPAADPEVTAAGGALLPECFTARSFRKGDRLELGTSGLPCTHPAAWGLFLPQCNTTFLYAKGDKKSPAGVNSHLLLLLHTSQTVLLARNQKEAISA